MLFLQINKILVNPEPNDPIYQPIARIDQNVFVTQNDGYGKKKQHYVNVIVELNIKNVVNYFQNNYVDGVGLSHVTFVFDNFDDFLNYLIHEELVHQTYRKLSVYEESGVPDEPLLDFDKSGEFTIQLLKMRTDWWRSRRDASLAKIPDRLFGKIENQ